MRVARALRRYAAVLIVFTAALATLATAGGCAGDTAPVEPSTADYPYWVEVGGLRSYYTAGYEMKDGRVVLYGVLDSHGANAAELLVVYGGAEVRITRRVAP